MSTTKPLAEFRASREAVNRPILDQGIKRFFTVAIKAHADSTLNSPKEFAKLTASLMLQCDDCISYHVIRCRARGLS